MSKTIDTRYSFEIDIEEYSGPHYYAIQVQKVKDETPIGSISVLYGEQNKEAHYPISSSITEDTWTFVGNSL